MQATKVIKTIEWIDQQIRPTMREFIFGPRLLSEDRIVDVKPVLAATHEWAAVMNIWRASTGAVEVLEAFGLKTLLDPDAPALFAQNLLTSSNEKRMPAHELYTAITSPYNQMLSSKDKWKSLVVPEELRGAEIPPDILSFTLVSQSEASLATLSQALIHVLAVYANLADLLGLNAAAPTVVSIQSGSPITFNLKGLGDVFKQLNEFSQEAWDRIRFRDQHRQLANNEVILSGLHVMDELHQRELAGTIEREAAEKIRRGLTDGILGMIECQTLPSNIVSIQVIPNEKLLQSYGQKLLPEIAGVADSSSKTKATSKAAPRPHKKAGVRREQRN